jgi:hypothetical protein
MDDYQLESDHDQSLLVRLRSVEGGVEVPVTFAADAAVLAAVQAVSACALTKGGTPAEQVTCTNASTDYAASAAMPAGTKYVIVYCASACIVAMGEATAANKGVYVGAGMPTAFPVTVTGTADDDKPHVQSATAGAVVRLTYMRDA